VREALLERLFDALQEDRMPYIEHLGDFWGQLCMKPSIASAWAVDHIKCVADETSKYRGDAPSQ
jgi:hypothetical protein